jgi:hypothetical protein
MNNIRSPAPAGSLFNMGGLNVPRNNGFVEDVADTVNAATNTAFNAVKNVANTAFNVAGNATNGMLNIAGNATNMASNKAGNIASKLASGSQMILIVGIFIILPGLKKDSEYFAMRFIGLTTLQMLSMMTLIAVLIFGNLSEPRYWAFTAIILFAFLLSIQSFLFIKEVNKK